VLVERKQFVNQWVSLLVPDSDFSAATAADLTSPLDAATANDANHPI